MTTQHVTLDVCVNSRLVVCKILQYITTVMGNSSYGLEKIQKLYRKPGSMKETKMQQQAILNKISQQHLQGIKGNYS